MSKDLVKKSLKKFLSDNLTYSITDDNNKSLLTNISDIQVNSDIPTLTKTFTLYNYGAEFKTNENIVGKVLQLDIYSDTIANWSNTTSTVTLDNGFTVDILTSDKMSILFDSLIYINNPHSIINSKFRKHNMKNSDRYDLVIKVKDDSDKSKINSILQNIRNLIMGKYCNFNIYNTDEITILGNAKIEINTYEEKELLNVGDDMQSYLVTFLVSYFIKY